MAHIRTLLLSGVLLLFSAQAHATSVGLQTDHCPFCHHDYLGTVLLSYNTFSGNTEPPKMPPSACPFCLAVWTGDPPKELTEQQRQRLHAALESWPNDLSNSERGDLLRELDERYSDDVRGRIKEALQRRCAAALNGEKMPQFVVNPTRFGKSMREHDQKDHETFLTELPRLIQEQKKGRKAVIRPQSKKDSEDIVTLEQAQGEIVAGNVLGFEFFVRWAVALDDATLLHAGSSDASLFGDILFDVARCKKMPWPKDVDIGKAHSSFAAACLWYAYEPARQLEGPLKQAIMDPIQPGGAESTTKSSIGKEKADEHWLSPFERAQIVLKAAAGKKDRAAAELILSLTPAELDKFGDTFTLYYQRIGKAEDLEFLEKCAAEAMNKLTSGKRRRRGEEWGYQDLLDAYEITRLKCQLRGEVVASASAK